MPMLALLLALPPLPTTDFRPLPACRATQLSLSLDPGDGDFNGMSHAGTALTIRNRGQACTLPALPTIELRDARGRVLPAVRRAPPGMHPGPVLLPVRLAPGGRATATLRWISGPVFPSNRSIRPASLSVRIGTAVVRAPLTATLYGQAGKAVSFDQSPLAAPGLPTAD